MYLLDSNICIAVINQNPRVLTEFNLKSNQCCISTIVMAELYKGVYFSQRIERNLQTLKLFINSVEVIDFDKNAAEEFGKIQLELKRIGRPTGVFDAAIAAVALSRGDVLVTDNIRHFINISALQLENWLGTSK